MRCGVHTEKSTLTGVLDWSVIHTCFLNIVPVAFLGHHRSEASVALRINGKRSITDGLMNLLSSGLPLVAIIAICQDGEREGLPRL